MSHTPGPWSVDSSMISTGWVLVTKSNGDVVANVNTETGPDIPPTVSIKMPALSNAHIIAAAPEMLAILEELRESSTCCGTYDLLDETTWASPDLVDRIEAAIKKARGEE